MGANRDGKRLRTHVAGFVFGAVALGVRAPPQKKEINKTCWEMLEINKNMRRNHDFLIKMLAAHGLSVRNLWPRLLIWRFLPKKKKKKSSLKKNNYEIKNIGCSADVEDEALSKHSVSYIKTLALCLIAYLCWLSERRLSPADICFRLTHDRKTVIFICSLGAAARTLVALLRLHSQLDESLSEPTSTPEDPN